MCVSACTAPKNMRARVRTWRTGSNEFRQTIYVVTRNLTRIFWQYRHTHTHRTAALRTLMCYGCRCRRHTRVTIVPRACSHAATATTNTYTHAPIMCNIPLGSTCKYNKFRKAVFAHAFRARAHSIAVAAVLGGNRSRHHVRSCVLVHADGRAGRAHNCTDLWSR